MVVDRQYVCGSEGTQNEEDTYDLRFTIHAGYPGYYVIQC